jgi:hypothetical protein
MASLIDVRGIRIAATDHDRVCSHTIDRAVVMLPEVIVEGETIAAEDLRPAFDALWQSSGWPRSPNFGADGKWALPRR